MDGRDGLSRKKSAFNAYPLSMEGLKAGSQGAFRRGH